MKPVYLKISKSVEAIAREQQYQIILNKEGEASGLLMYYDRQFDITPLVLERLGMKNVGK